MGKGQTDLQMGEGEPVFFGLLVRGEGMVCLVPKFPILGDNFAKFDSKSGKNYSSNRVAQLFGGIFGLHHLGISFLCSVGRRVVALIPNPPPNPMPIPMPMCGRNVTRPSAGAQ